MSLKYAASDRLILEAGYTLTSRQQLGFLSDGGVAIPSPGDVNGRYQTQSPLQRVAQYDIVRIPYVSLFGQALGSDRGITLTSLAFVWQRLDLGVSVGFPKDLPQPVYISQGGGGAMLEELIFFGFELDVWVQGLVWPSVHWSYQNAAVSTATAIASVLTFPIEYWRAP